MELRSILTADYLDIIFDNRHKNYGAYELRKHYNERAAKGTFVVLASVLLLLGAHAFASRFKTTEIITQPTERVIVMDRLKVDEPKPEIEVIKTAPPPAAPSIKITPPVIVPNDEVTEDPPTVDDMKNKTPSTVNNDGDPDGIDPALTEKPGNGPPTTGVVEQPSPEPPIKDYVEQMPAFDGDVNQYLANNINYPAMARETGIKGRVAIRFVVNEDGSVSNATVLKGIGGGCEEEAIRVIKSMPKWKPGKQNGKAVKVYFTLPVNFVLG